MKLISQSLNVNPIQMWYELYGTVNFRSIQELFLFILSEMFDLKNHINDSINHFPISSLNLILKFRVYIEVI